MKKQVLITGGPVHDYIDDVKIITNRFKGGLMYELATRISNTEYDYDIIFLTSKHTPVINKSERIEVVYHDGFQDYYDKVLNISRKSDAVILGAAVANLIPQNRIQGKFPSHNYNIGDVIPINFTIAPRVINEIKKTNPRIFLCGFKLLSGVSKEELIDAAYDIVIDSKANLVVANDAKNLDYISLVTKEKSVIPEARTNLPSILVNHINDKYYHTAVIPFKQETKLSDIAEKTLNVYKDKFKINKRGYMFGAVAELPDNSASIIVSARGKKTLSDLVWVSNVSNNDLSIISTGKPSLNTPLLWNILFKSKIHDLKGFCRFIIHFHEQIEGLPTLDYAPPGTERDSNREIITSFNIKHHGCFLMFNKYGVRL